MGESVPVPCTIVHKVGTHTVRKQVAIFVALFALATSFFMFDVGGPGTVRAQASGHSTFYVSMHGSDAAVGSRKHPFRTIQHAVRAVPSGSRVLVRQGTYSGFEVTKNGKFVDPEGWLGW